jgi:nicotinate-nucleotide--dimethylbenzimidazole phosphoribosyltransferase
MAGFVLGAASHGLPVVIDGFISSSALLISRCFYPAIADHVFFAHRSAEFAHRRLLEVVNAQPLLDLDLCLGEGTGAALAMGLLTSAVKLYTEMSTFAEASVSDL